MEQFSCCEELYKDYSEYMMSTNKEVDSVNIIEINSSLDEMESVSKVSISRTPSRRSDMEVAILTDEESVAFMPSPEILELANFNTPQYFRRVLGVLQLMGRVGCERGEFEKARFDRPRRVEVHFLADASFDAWGLIFGYSRKCFDADSYRDFYPESERLEKKAIAKIEKCLNPGCQRFTRYLNESLL